MASTATVAGLPGVLAFMSGNSGATSVSTGTTSSTPFFSARSRYSWTTGIWSSWSSDEPTS